jgi:transposase
MMSNESSSEPQWAAYVAIDWADREHVWKMQPAESDPCESGKVEQTPEAIEIWASQLATRFNGRPIAVALEQSRGPLVFSLTKYSHLHLFPVHPSMLAHFREAMVPSGAKNDPGDTGLLLELLVQHRSRLRRLRPDTEQTRELQFLVENRRGLVDDKTYFSNRLIAQLKLYYPQILRWFYKPASPVACDFLLRWPSLAAAQKATSRALTTFFSKHNCQDVERRIEEIRKAVCATHDQAVIRSAMFMAQATVRQIQTIQQDISQCEERIEQLTKSHPDFAIFDSLPGAGDALIPRLIAALGTQRDRFSSAAEIQSYSGIAPVVKQSGNTRMTHCRQAYPRFLRQTFHEWALHSILKSAWARVYYERQLEHGKKHHTAIRALAYKWIRILYRCWKDRLPYVENCHADAQKKRSRENTPAEAENAVVELQCKKVAGFHKIVAVNY